MAKDKANNGKAKMELTARITLPDGTVVERTVTEDSLPSSEFDFTDLDKFLTTFDDYERKVVAARNQLAKDVSDAYMSEMSKKKKTKKS